MMMGMSDSLAPGFLIALPHLMDENFRQSVVLLLQQSETGAMGIVINHESPLLLAELCRDHSIPYAGADDRRVLCGGPVQPEHGLVLFSPEHDAPDGEHVLDGLNMSASRDTLARLCNLERGRFRCYAGYAGWGPGQLEREIGEGSWLVATADVSLVLETPADQVWAESLRAMGIDPAALVWSGGGEA
jgi:putative transcriptional regulator